MTAPTATIHQLTSRPTSANATPTATPIGQRLKACRVTLVLGLIHRSPGLRVAC